MDNWIKYVIPIIGVLFIVAIIIGIYYLKRKNYKKICYKVIDQNLKKWKQYENDKTPKLIKINIVNDITQKCYASGDVKVYNQVDLKDLYYEDYKNFLIARFNSKFDFLNIQMIYTGGKLWVTNKCLCIKNSNHNKPYFINYYQIKNISLISYNLEFGILVTLLNSSCFLFGINEPDLYFWVHFKFNEYLNKNKK